MTAKEHKDHKDHQDHKDQKSGSTASVFKGKLDIDSDKVKDAALLEHPSYVELQGKLTEAEEKANQYWERMLRMQAENDNTLRRCQRDVENAHKYALEKFVNELLPVVDSLERAISLHEDQQHSVLEGVDLTLKMFKSALEKFNVVQVDPLSELFNPELHQAVSTQADPNVQPGTVLNVLQKGYLLNNRLIRPALVVVSKAS
ncbi:MAG: nucleotide exchange factor GrpE [Gammaproteobacteria bacterium]